MATPAIVEDAINISAEEFNVGPSELLGRTRTQPVAFARHSAVWVIRQRSSLSLPAIGRYFDRDHTTVLSSCRAVERGTPPTLREGARRVLAAVDAKRAKHHPRLAHLRHGRLQHVSIEDLHARIDNAFGYHPPSTPEIVKAHEQVREILASAAHKIVDLVPDCPELDIALHNLELAMFSANGGIARTQSLRS